MKSLSPLLLAAALFAGSAPAFADDVTEQIDEALKAYAKQDLETAASALDAAAGLIRQQKAQALAALLPAPLPGWNADDAETSAAGPAMFGGGVHVERQYHKGELGVRVAITGDSPLLQGLMIMFNNAAMLGGDQKLAIVDGRKTLFNKGENTYRTLVANKVLVEVSGDEGVGEAVLKDYLRAINFAGLEARFR